MSTHRTFDRICAVATVFAVIFTMLIWYAVSGEENSSSSRTLGYENRLFDTSRVHVIDIVMDDWDTFIKGCESEEYSDCVVIIDGDRMKDVAIRAKGNTSLSSVRSMGSQRYSFKLEFDHYQKGRTYHGLDKLCLNNLIQDNTMMKDFLAYHLMADFGVDAPLCSYVYVRVNGEDWGLYLAVEGVEDGFISRNYGSKKGDLYKPDSMSFGGGRGNGRDFNMDDFDFSSIWGNDGSGAQIPFVIPGNGSGDGSGSEENRGRAQMPPSGQGMPTDGFGQSFGGQQGFGQFQGSQNGQPGDSNAQSGFGESFGGMNGFGGGQGDMPGGIEPPYSMPDDIPEGDESTERGKGGFAFGGMGGFGFGNSDVKLQYIDDDPASYPNIFNNAKTKVTEEDQEKLIGALKNLSENTDIANTVDVDEVIRYFVVHNFVCNGDSYTGAMIHNYYLYVEDGQMSMIPWDYNLAFGSFQGGSASSSVNADIDQPVTGGGVSDRPMIAWIYNNEEYLSEYHSQMQAFLDRWFSDGQLAQLIDDVYDMIRPYVDSDPTKFCTLEQFDQAVWAIRSFVTLRAEAVQKQLNGDKTKVDTGTLNISDMGTMNNGKGGFGGGDAFDFGGSFPDMDSFPDGMGQMPGGFSFGNRSTRRDGNSGRNRETSEFGKQPVPEEGEQVTTEPTPEPDANQPVPGTDESILPEESQQPANGMLPEGMTVPGGGSFPDGMTIPGGGSFPDGMTVPGGGTFPDGMTVPGGGSFPDGMTVPGNGMFPDGMTIPGGGTFPEGMTVPGGGTFPEGMTMPGNGNF